MGNGLLLTALAKISGKLFLNYPWLQLFIMSGVGEIGEFFSNRPWI